MFVICVGKAETGWFLDFSGEQVSLLSEQQEGERSSFKNLGRTSTEKWIKGWFLTLEYLNTLVPNHTKSPSEYTHTHTHTYTHTHCDGFNLLGSGSGTLKSCGLVGVLVAFWRKCIIVGVGFKTLILTPWNPVFCLLSEQDVALLAPPTPCLPGCCHVPALIVMEWTSKPVSQSN